MPPFMIADPVISTSAFVAPGAHIYGRVTLEHSVVVLFGAVIRAEMDRITVGAESNIQDNAVLHCDEGAPCILGNRVTVGHSAVVHGATVGDGALIGMGAKMLNASSLGEGAWLAAGSVLPEERSIPPWTLAMGIPAKPTRDLTEEEIRHASQGVDHYQSLADAYRRSISR